MLSEEEIMSVVGRKCGKLTVVEYVGFMSVSTLRSRLDDKGMSVGEAFETPVNKKFSPNKNKAV